MTWFRKWLILVHRYLGIALSFLVVLWFLSGIGMMYAREMPRLTSELRLERMEPLDFARIRFSPSEAFERAEVRGLPGRFVMLTIGDHPAYRFSGVTFFADSGELLDEVSAADTVAIASRFMRLPPKMMHHVAVPTSADQWTIGQRRQLPLDKITVDDAARTELYISGSLAEVVVYTTRASRALAWVATIPHWLYFAPLRLNDATWRRVVLWTSGLGAFLALLGLVLGVIQFSPLRQFRVSRILSYNPYTGWMRWHYITGILFGIFTLTWVFSGMLSMEPWDWASGGGLGAGMRQAMSGGPLDPSLFPAVPAAAWNQALAGHPAKEVELVRLQGDPYYIVRGATAEPLVLSAHRLEARRELFSTESILRRVKDASPEAGIVETRMLSDFDAYYRGRDPKPPLPVLRIKFDDPDSTWFYIDPSISQPVSRFTRRERLQRWVYHGFHSLDFAFLYYNRPLWDIVVIALSIGGAASGAIGLFVGLKRVGRGAKRATKRLTGR